VSIQVFFFSQSSSSLRSHPHHQARRRSHAETTPSTPRHPSMLSLSVLDHSELCTIQFADTNLF
jgi:hypothetical protein